MANKNKFTKSTVKRAIEGSRGNLTTVAETLLCSRQTVHNYLERYPDLKDLLTQERETLVDKAENLLAKLIDAENVGAIYFVLETLGKNRGWTKRHELTGADGEDLKFTFGGIIDEAEDKAPSTRAEPTP